MYDFAPTGTRLRATDPALYSSSPRRSTQMNHTLPIHINALARLARLARSLGPAKCIPPSAGCCHSSVSLSLSPFSLSLSLHPFSLSSVSPDGGDQRKHPLSLYQSPGLVPPRTNGDKTPVTGPRLGTHVMHIVPNTAPSLLSLSL